MFFTKYRGAFPRAGLALIMMMTPSIYSSHARADSFRGLASYYAPIVQQEIGSHPSGDRFTIVEFDGDLDPENNWKNLDRFPTPLSVYYDVIESRTHFFITYGFFYPRDYARICFPIHCHENDFEGLRLDVLKDGSEYGKLLAIEVSAHGGFELNRNPPARQLASEPDGSAPHPRALVWIEKEGHGVHAGKIRTWHPVEERVGYDLVPLFHLWNLRDQLGPRHKLYYQAYEHRGERFSVGKVPYTIGGRKYTNWTQPHPPWAWKAWMPQLGDWFFDPALAFCRAYDCDASASLNYVHNPYLDGAEVP